MEIVQQMEVIKGASSVLYGSSAINGVVALRTAWPGSEPVNTVSVYNGIFDNPVLRIINGGTSSSLLRFQLFASGSNTKSGSGIERTCQQKQQQPGRDNSATVHVSPGRPACIQQDNRISYGINGNILLNDEGIFFLFADADTNLAWGIRRTYRRCLHHPAELDLPTHHHRPWLNIHDNHDGNHRIRSRFYHHGCDLFRYHLRKLLAAESGLSKYNRAFKDFVITTGVSGCLFSCK